MKTKLETMTPTDPKGGPSWCGCKVIASRREVYFCAMHAAAPELLAVAEWVVKGEHHSACPIPRGTGWNTINGDDCACQVKAARAAIAKAGKIA